MFKQHAGLLSKILLTAFVVLLSLSACSQAGDSTQLPTARWSDTQPAVNLEHIFHGEINRRGKPTGFHSAPGGNAPESARIRRVVNGPNKAGVYTARVEVYDKSSGQWREKFSSMFPDSLTPQQVTDAVVHAWQNRDKSRKQPWSGPSGLGFPIQGYVLNDGRINTAFPVFIQDR
ncbi:EndoU domain-containing protein [Granulosicoccaceae sp. 1_MG-2023]|nr:EndoU domain-containing protein [Granulosicoccaceae sp. 1_MG-2023]